MSEYLRFTAELFSHPDTYLRYGPAVPHQNFISIWVLSVARKINLNVSPNHPEIFIGECTKCEIGSRGIFEAVYFPNEAAYRKKLQQICGTLMMGLHHPQIWYSSIHLTLKTSPDKITVRIDLTPVSCNCKRTAEARSSNGGGSSQMCIVYW